ncbi:hypothetical protein, partial [Pantoea ananatis]|uniref:hypothetical protein n=1 Tax=Pantoea ananas TaxID=553 RepID=UPI003D0C90D6
FHLWLRCQFDQHGIAFDSHDLLLLANACALTSEADGVTGFQRLPFSPMIQPCPYDMDGLWCLSLAANEIMITPQLMPNDAPMPLMASTVEDSAGLA